MAPRITQKGIEFAIELAPWIGAENAIFGQVQEFCSVIARLASEHHALAEHACNRSLTASEKARDEQIEAKIREHVSGLSTLTDEPMHAKFQGDPRGFTVRVVIPRAAPHYGNTWGKDGEFGI